MSKEGVKKTLEYRKPSKIADLNLDGLMEKRRGKTSLWYENENKDGEIIAKRCGKCATIKLIADYSPHKLGLGGKQAACKVCMSETTRKYYIEHIKEGIPRQRQNPYCSRRIVERKGISGKMCTKCNEWKSLFDFPKDRRGVGGVRTDCKLCNSNNSREYREKYPDRSIESVQRWQKNNPDQRHLVGLRRRARKKSVIDDLTAEQMKEVLNTFGGCVFTGSCDIHWDHVIPLATGHGGTTFGNMIPLRNDLNMSKHDINIFEWFEANRQRFELSQERFDNLIAWLASANAMTVEEYRDHVYWCHANPRSIDELEAQ